MRAYIIIGERTGTDVQYRYVHMQYLLQTTRRSCNVTRLGAGEIMMGDAKHYGRERWAARVRVGGRGSSGDWSEGDEDIGEDGRRKMKVGG